MRVEYGYLVPLFVCCQLKCKLNGLNWKSESKVLIDRVFANQAPTNQITPNEISLSAVQLLEQGVDLMLYGAKCSWCYRLCCCSRCHD